MERNLYFDNAKFILILLVVFGHMIEPIIKTDSIIEIMYLFIYSFHMPAFIILAGMFSKNKLSEDYIMKIIKRIFIPYIIFTILYELFNYFYLGEVSKYLKNNEPYWILWFLLSLSIWKLILPIILKFKYPVILSLLLSILIGYFDNVGSLYGLSRTIYFFPFFIIGYKIKPDGLIKIKNQYKLIPILIILVSVIIFTSFYNNIDYQWLYGKYSYLELGYGEYAILSGLMRLLIITLSVFTAISVLTLISNKENKLIKGNHSLFVYLWHGFIIKIMIANGLILYISNYGVILSIIILGSLSLILTIFLSNNFLYKKS